MTVATAAIAQNQSHTAEHLATAHVVGGGSARAVAAASAILASFADDMGLGKERAAAMNDNHVKDTAVKFAVAGLAFANVDAGHKAPAAAPDVSGKDTGVSI